jgi:hypothetical protein
VAVKAAARKGEAVGSQTNLLNSVAETAGRAAAKVVNVIESLTGAGRKRR